MKTCSWCNEQSDTKEVISGVLRLNLCFDCITSLSVAALSQLQPTTKKMVLDLGRREAATKAQERSHYKVPQETAKFVERAQNNADQWQMPPRNQRAIEQALSDRRGRDVGLRPKGGPS